MPELTRPATTRRSGRLDGIAAAIATCVGQRSVLATASVSNVTSRAWDSSRTVAAEACCELTRARLSEVCPAPLECRLLRVVVAGRDGPLQLWSRASAYRPARRSSSARTAGQPVPGSSTPSSRASPASGPSASATATARLSRTTGEPVSASQLVVARPRSGPSRCPPTGGDRVLGGDQRLEQVRRRRRRRRAAEQRDRLVDLVVVPAGAVLVGKQHQARRRRRARPGGSAGAASARAARRARCSAAAASRSTRTSRIASAATSARTHVGPRSRARSRR